MTPRQHAMQRVLRAASDVARHWRPGRDSEGEGIIAELLSGLRDLGSVLDRRPPRRPARLRCKLRGAAKCNDEPQYGCSCASCEYREAQRAERLVARRYVFGADGSYVKRGAL